jgi:hypothetical protein
MHKLSDKEFYEYAPKLIFSNDNLRVPSDESFLSDTPDSDD